MLWSKNKLTEQDQALRTWRTSLLSLVERGEVCIVSVWPPIATDVDCLVCSLCSNTAQHLIDLEMVQPLGFGPTSLVRQIRLSLVCCTGCVSSLTRNLIAEE